MSTRAKKEDPLTTRKFWTMATVGVARGGEAGAVSDAVEDLGQVIPEVT